MTGLVPGMSLRHTEWRWPFRSIHACVAPLSAAMSHVCPRSRQTAGAVKSSEPDGVETI
jgi:hypothetical protein